MTTSKDIFMEERQHGSIMAGYTVNDESQYPASCMQEMRIEILLAQAVCTPEQRSEYDRALMSGLSMKDAEELIDRLTQLQPEALDRVQGGYMVKQEDVNKAVFKAVSMPNT